MKTKLYPVTICLLLFSSCQKDNKPETPSSSKGPWDGTYVMSSTQTIRADTVDSTPYSGGLMTTWNDTSAGSSFTGSLIITKDSMKLSGFSFLKTTKGIRKEYVSATNKTTATPINSSYTVTGSNLPTAYTISSLSDSVTVKDAMNIALVAYGTPSKIRASVSGNSLTFFSESYTVYQSGTGYERANYKTRFITTTVYQKQ